MDASSGRIVVGVDDSPQAHHALQWARDEALLRGAALEVVHVWAPPAPVSEIAAMATSIDEGVYEAAAQAVLEGALATISSDVPAGVVVEPQLLRGYTSSVLLERAAHADLLVVGSRGRGGFASLLLGSVSHQCVHHATGPVAVIPASASLPSAADVVVGIDNSPTARRALTWAAQEAGTRKARLSVVHAWSVSYAVPLGGFGVAPADPGDVSAWSQGLLHELAEVAVKEARERPTGVELLSVEEPPAPALIDRAKGAGLLVVGSRGAGGFASLLLGSVSLQCLHHATCAVVVVPKQD